MDTDQRASWLADLRPWFARGSRLPPGCAHPGEVCPRSQLGILRVRPGGSSHQVIALAIRPLHVIASAAGSVNGPALFLALGVPTGAAFCFFLGEAASLRAVPQLSGASASMGGGLPGVPGCCFPMRPCDPQGRLPCAPAIRGGALCAFSTVVDTEARWRKLV